MSAAGTSSRASTTSNPALVSIAPIAAASLAGLGSGVHALIGGVADHQRDALVGHCRVREEQVQAESHRNSRERRCDHAPDIFRTSCGSVPTKSRWYQRATNIPFTEAASASVPMPLRRRRAGRQFLLPNSRTRPGSRRNAHRISAAQGASWPWCDQSGSAKRRLCTSPSRLHRRGTWCARWSAPCPRSEPAPPEGPRQAGGGTAARRPNSFRISTRTAVSSSRLAMRSRLRAKRGSVPSSGRSSSFISLRKVPSLPTPRKISPVARGKHGIGHQIRMLVAGQRRRLAVQEIVGGCADA